MEFRGSFYNVIATLRTLYTLRLSERANTSHRPAAAESSHRLNHTCIRYHNRQHLIFWIEIISVIVGVLIVITSRICCTTELASAACVERTRCSNGGQIAFIRCSNANDMPQKRLNASPLSVLTERSRLCLSEWDSFAFSNSCAVMFFIVTVYLLIFIH